MGGERDDQSSRSNPGFLREILEFNQVWTIPFLGNVANDPSAVKRNCKKIKKVLARLLESDDASNVLSNVAEKAS